MAWRSWWPRWLGSRRCCRAGPASGVLIGDERAPYKGEIARFHSALASLAEIVAFVMLGLTVRLYALPRGGAWLIGLALAALLAFVIRPLLVGVVLWPVRLRLSERVFVLWSGLKGAVPILLGAFIVQAGSRTHPGSTRSSSWSWRSRSSCKAGRYRASPGG